MDIVRTFQENTSSVLAPNSRLLLAVSGGMDSSVLLHLCSKSHYPFAIAYCNFQLRGEESSKEEEHIVLLAQKYNVELYKKSFATKQYAHNQKISIEMAARVLRYRFFEETLKEKGYSYLLTGHHLEDNIETFFLNLLRGTGLKGLSSMQLQNNYIIRPLLQVTKEEIIRYCHEQNLTYHEDSSNQLLVYKRNAIRHRLLPLLEQLAPSFRKQMLQMFSVLQETNSIFLEKIDEAYQKCLTGKDRLSIEELKKLPHLRTYLFEFLSPYGFNKETVDDIIRSLDGQSGKQFHSATHMLVKDRDELIFSSPYNSVGMHYTIVSEKDNQSPIRIEAVESIVPDLWKSVVNDKEKELINLAKIKFPLTLRRWSRGDKFIPLGSSHYKKISDFFIDRKVPISKKNETWLLCNGNKEIIWIVGYQIDNRYKIEGKELPALLLQSPKQY